MNVLFVVSEVLPFSKTGGLGDVGAALPGALRRLGHDVRVVTPAYRGVRDAGVPLRATAFGRRSGSPSRTPGAAVLEGRLPGTDVPVYCVDLPAFFDRPGLYQEAGRDYPDNLARFSAFCQAARRLQQLPDWRADLIHAHDWHTALLCAHLAFGPQDAPRLPTVLTVHNLAYQGVFPADQWAQTELPRHAFTPRGLEFYGRINCLKGGLVSASQLTTVSPTYAAEIQTAEFGCGLEGVVRGRGDALTGILNGIDTTVWDPQRDPLLPARYGPDAMEGKAACKRALQARCGLPPSGDLLIGMVQRFVEQKGLDLLLEGLEALMALPIQLVVLGTGDPEYERGLADAARRFPRQLAVQLTFDEATGHLIEAGADAFLAPSRFEPCGLNQMYSMRYGTVPIVRRIGGLADTVVDVTTSTTNDRTATGLTFDAYAVPAMVEAVQRAVVAFGARTLWTQLRQTGMRQDFSWDRSARAYDTVYARAQRHPVARPWRPRRWWWPWG